MNDHNPKRKSATPLVRQYAVLLWRLTSDAVWRFKWRVLATLLTGFLGVTFQVAAIGQVIYYAKALKDGKTIVLLDYSFQVRESLPLLFLFGLGLLLLLLSSALLIYLSRVLVVRIGEIYEVFCARRVIRLFGQDDGAQNLNEKEMLDDKTLLQTVSLDSRYCGRIVRIFMGAFIPAVYVIIALISLFYIDAIFSTFVLLVMAISYAFLYKVNVRGASRSILFETSRRDSKAEMLNAIRFISTKGHSCERSDSSWLDRVFESAKFEQHLHSYRERLLAVEKSKLVSNILFAVGIFSIVAYFGGRSFLKKGDWGSMIVYVLALRYCLTNLRTLNSTLTSMNRFFPQLKRYFLAIDTMSPWGGKARRCEIDKYSINSSVGAITGSLESYDADRGMRVGVVFDSKLNIYTAGFVLEGLWGDASREIFRGARNACRLVNMRIGYMPVSLVECFGFPADTKPEDLREDLEHLGLWEQFVLMKDGMTMNEVISEESWRSFSEELRYGLSLIAVMRFGGEPVVVDEAGLRLFSERSVGYIMESLVGRHVVIVYCGARKHPGRYGEDVIAVVQGGEVVGLGSVRWCVDHWAEIVNRLESGKCGTFSALDVDEDDEIDEGDADE